MRGMGMTEEGRAMLDLTPIQRAWPELIGGRAQPLTRGTNNRMYRVDAPIGPGAYVLRIAGRQVNPSRILLERVILAQVRALTPFAVPIVLPTAQGDLYARVETAEGEALATLTPLIPGSEPRRDDLAQTERAGEAIALLDEALERVRLKQPDEALSWRSTGDLAHCHPLVPDPRAAIGELALPAEAARRLLADYDALLERLAPLYASLPRQLCHEDTDPSNLLMEGERVTGVLDWEFCALDLRPTDLVVALTWWPVERFGTGEEWPIITALLRGYARRRSLLAAEVAAIPTLFQLRAYTSLIHRLGRQREGLSSMEQVLWRAQAALERADWLAANSERLTQLVDEALHRARGGA